MLEEIVKSGGTGLDTERLAGHFEEMCKNGILRNIAQNFTTVWYKTFGPLSEHSCTACGMRVHVSADADSACPNPSCGAAL